MPGETDPGPLRSSIQKSGASEFKGQGSGVDGEEVGEEGRLEGLGGELTWPRRGAPGAGAERTPHNQTAGAERTPHSPTAEAAASSWSARGGKGCASWSSWTGWTPRGRPEAAATVASSRPPPPPAAPTLLCPPPGPCGRTYLGSGSPAFRRAPSVPAPSAGSEARTEPRRHRSGRPLRGDDGRAAAQRPRVARAAQRGSPGEARASGAAGEAHAVPGLPGARQLRGSDTYWDPWELRLLTLHCPSLVWELEGGRFPYLLCMCHLPQAELLAASDLCQAGRISGLAMSPA